MWQTKTCKHTNTSTFLKEQQINHILLDNEIEIRGDTWKSKMRHKHSIWIHICFNEKNNKHAWWKNVLVKCTRNVLIKF